MQGAVQAVDLTARTLTDRRPGHSPSTTVPRSTIPSRRARWAGSRGRPHRSAWVRRCRWHRAGDAPREGRRQRPRSRGHGYGRCRRRGEQALSRRARSWSTTRPRCSKTSAAPASRWVTSSSSRARIPCRRRAQGRPGRTGGRRRRCGSGDDERDRRLRHEIRFADELRRRRAGRHDDFEHVLRQRQQRRSRSRREGRGRGFVQCEWRPGRQESRLPSRERAELTAG